VFWTDHKESSARGKDGVQTEACLVRAARDERDVGRQVFKAACTRDVERRGFEVARTWDISRWILRVEELGARGEGRGAVCLVGYSGDGQTTQKGGGLSYFMPSAGTFLTMRCRLARILRWCALVVVDEPGDRELGEEDHHIIDYFHHT
jgi:hypothetical protein